MSDQPTGTARASASRGAIVLAGITVLGALLRLNALGHFSIWYDEGATLYAATLVDHPSRLLDPDWCTDPPLLPLLTRVWWDLVAALGDLDPLTEQADFVLRLLPCAFSIATIPLAYLLAREVIGKPVPALIAALLVAVSPFQIYYAQELKPYSSLTVFGICVVYSLLRALLRDRPGAWIAMTLFMVLSMYNHFYSVWTIFACNVAFVLAAPRRLTVYTKWFICQSAVIVLSWPAIRQGLTINRITEEVDVSWYPPLTTDVALITFKNFFAGYTPGLLVPATLAIMAAIFAVSGIWSLRGRYRQWIVSCVVALLPVVGNSILWQTREFSYYQHRLFILSAILLSILAAAGIAAIKIRGLRFAALSCTLLLTALCLPDYYAQRLHPSEQHRLGVRYKVDNRGVASLIRSEWKPGDAIAHFSHFSLLPMRYRYLPDLPQFTVGFTEQDTLDMIHSFPLRTLWDNVGALPRRIDSIAGESKRIWLVESWWEPDNLFPTARLYRTWLDLHAMRIARFPLDGVTLYLYDRQAVTDHHARAVQVADAGDVAAPYYLRFTPNPAAFSGQAWIESFQETVETMETDPRADFPILSAGNGILGSGTDSSGVRLRYAIDREDDRDKNALRMAVLTSHQAIVPLQFDRESPDSDDWRPIQHGNPDFKGDIDEFAYAATLRAGDPETTALTASARLAPGRYSVYARIWRETGPFNASRARVRFALASSGEAPDGAQMWSQEWGVVPFSQSGQSGWAWFRLGTFVQTGSAPVTVRVDADNHAGLPQAFADLGRVCFVPDAADPDLYGYGDNMWGPLSTDEHGALVLASPDTTGESVRMDVILYDADHNRYRSIAFYRDRQ
ncbi:MAG: glycosyltransferase family 39 protein [Candidatus Hydrogenedentes bacterium]|nr:glycosyltransferase family 39 protein [Candidatus Hydrogenedentota bacterium]